MTTSKKPTGRVPLEAIRSMTIPRLPAPILAAFAQIDDLTCTVSDAMDNLGLRGAIAASAVAPNLPQARWVGQARFRRGNCRAGRQCRGRNRTAAKSRAGRRAASRAGRR